MAAQFTSEGATLSGVDLELVGSGYRMSLVKRRFATGICPPCGHAGPERRPVLLRAAAGEAFGVLGQERQCWGLETQDGGHGWGGVVRAPLGGSGGAVPWGEQEAPLPPHPHPILLPSQGATRAWGCGNSESGVM